MSHATRRPIGTLLFTLAVAGLCPATARAGAIVYDTSGIVGSSGVTGKNVISFVPISQNSFSSPSTLSLGTFVVAALPAGQTTTYNHTPFAVSFAVSTVNGISVSPNPPLLTLTGFLNGSLTGANLSTVIAVFDPIPNPNAQIGPHLFVNLSLPSPERTLVPSTTLGGQSSAEGFVMLPTVARAGGDRAVRGAGGRAGAFSAEARQDRPLIGDGGRAMTSRRSRADRAIDSGPVRAAAPLTGRVAGADHGGVGNTAPIAGPRRLDPYPIHSGGVEATATRSPGVFWAWGRDRSS